MPKIRVGCYEGNETIEINKPYDYITYKDIQRKVGRKRIVGWCKLEGSQ